MSATQANGPKLY